MNKLKITRTYGPIHFEDLDPHRFEDLIRELIYDFRDWQSIEATGRSGNDEGFDIRAFEKIDYVLQSLDENNEEIEELHPMEGNLWMIQVKREKEIGPKKMSGIISEIDSKNAPYGYILAASTNFSKKSYDLFREELRKKEVMEFYLWGKAELEDMLLLPKNDRLLFTFFGISLVSKRKKRKTEIRSAVIAKNKLFKITREDYQFFRQPILVRDLEDTNYPNENKYRDFKVKPRWREYTAFNHHPLGILCHCHEYFAYIDIEKKEWDYTKEADFVYRERESADEREIIFKKRELVNDFWEFLPRKNKGHFVIDGLIKYADIVLIDDKGDAYYNFPHIYVDFIGDYGPFAGTRSILKIKKNEIDLTEEYERINVFPKEFKKIIFGKVYKDKTIYLNNESLKEFKDHKLDTIYTTKEKYNFLNSRDIIRIDSQEIEVEEQFIQITYKFKTDVETYIQQLPEDSHKIKRDIEMQLGQMPSNDEEIYIYEFKRIGKFDLENYL